MDSLPDNADIAGPVAGLSLAPEPRRGHGALYDAVSHGRVGIARLCRVLAGLPLPRGGRAAGAGRRRMPG